MFLARPCVQIRRVNRRRGRADNRLSHEFCIIQNGGIAVFNETANDRKAAAKSRYQRSSKEVDRVVTANEAIIALQGTDE